MRAIDADALMKDICDSLDQMTDIGIAVDGDWLWAKLNDAIDNAPTIEPERKKGKWIKMSDADGIFYACSDCGEWHEEISNYCPNCGTRMDMRGDSDG